MTSKEFFLWLSGFMSANPKKIDVAMLKEKMSMVEDLQVKVQWHDPTPVGSVGKAHFTGTMESTSQYSETR